MLALGQRYVRDLKVRTFVIRRAKGLCEFCEKPGSMKEDRTRYLEARHILSLASDVQDRETNVIAL
jgi:5-methylcytosine-specific restriction protein A